MGMIPDDVENRIQAMCAVLDTKLVPINTSETRTSFTVRGLSEQNLWEYVRENNLVDTFKCDYSNISEGHKFKFDYYECEEYRMSVVLRWHSEDSRINFCEPYSASQCWTAKIELHIQPLDTDGNPVLKNPKKLFLMVDQKTKKLGRTRNETSMAAHIPIVDNFGALRRTPAAGT